MSDENQDMGREARFKVGDIVSYGNGVTALMRIKSGYPMGGQIRYYGMQYFGGSVGAYQSNCRAATNEQIIAFEAEQANREGAAMSEGTLTLKGVVTTPDGKMECVFVCMDTTSGRITGIVPDPSDASVAGPVKTTTIKLDRPESEEPRYDAVNPAHYNDDECMRVIAEVTRVMHGARAFCIGQAIKYLWRAGEKSGESIATDLLKASWYLNWWGGYAGLDVPFNPGTVESILHVLCSGNSNFKQRRAVLRSLL